MDYERMYSLVQALFRGVNWLNAERGSLRVIIGLDSARWLQAYRSAYRYDHLTQQHNFLIVHTISKSIIYESQSLK